MILDVSLWPSNDNMLSTFCDDEIKELTEYYEILLCQNGFNTHQIPTEWDCLKSYLFANFKIKIKNLQVWKEIFSEIVFLRNAKMFFTALKFY